MSEAARPNPRSETGTIPGDAMTVRDHDYQQKVGERLTALETKMTVFYWLVGPLVS